MFKADTYENTTEKMTEVSAALQYIMNSIQRKFPQRPKSVQFDNARELKTVPNKEFFRQDRTTRTFTAPSIHDLGHKTYKFSVQSLMLLVPCF